MVNGKDRRPRNQHKIGTSVICGCRRVFIPFRCPSTAVFRCAYCRYERAGEFFLKFNIRFGLSGHSFDSRYYMWTLGTPIKYWTDFTDDPKRNSGLRRVNNIASIIQPWQTFNTYMKVIPKRQGYSFRWNPLVYVVEAGKPCNKEIHPDCFNDPDDCPDHGQRLHIHFLHKGFLPHAYVRNVWSRITGIPNPNVNYIPNVRSIGYLAKYVSKSLLRYSFLRELYNVKVPKMEKSGKCADCNVKWQLDSHRISIDDFEPSIIEYFPDKDIIDSLPGVYPDKMKFPSAGLSYEEFLKRLKND